MLKNATKKFIDDVFCCFDALGRNKLQIMAFDANNAVYCARVNKLTVPGKIAYLKQDWRFIYHIENPCEKMCHIAMTGSHGYVLSFIKRFLDHEQRLKFIEQWPHCLYLLEPHERSDEINLTAIKKHITVITWLEGYEQTKEIQLEAIKISGGLISYIKEPCEEVCVQIIQQVKK